MTERRNRRQSSKPIPANRAAGAADPGQRDPELQGEGNYTAARRHRKSLERFVGSGQVGRAARGAAPRSADEARELREAEEAGRSHARK